MSSPSDCADPVNWRYDPVDNHTDWPYHAYASLAFPIDAEELLFKAEGSRAHGTFEVSQSTNISTEAVVDIDVAYRSEDALAEATVCHLKPSENKHGLGIFVSATCSLCPCTTAYVGAINRPSAGTTLSLTTSSASTSMYVSRLQRRAIRARSTHSIPTCRCSCITSPSWRTRSSSSLSASRRQIPRSGPMYVQCAVNLLLFTDTFPPQSLRAEIGKLRSSNGKIEGTFNTSESLELRTSNAPIHVTANLINSNKDAGTVLTADTSNGYAYILIYLSHLRSHPGSAIQAHVGLFAHSVDGAFRVNTRTTNAVARVTVTDAPANSLLNASAVSSNAPVIFEAHAAFEGSFELYSARFSPPTVEQPHPVEDPLGEGRNRTVQVNTIGRGAIRGEVGWEPKHEKAKSGHIRLKTSNAGASLFL